MPNKAEFIKRARMLRKRQTPEEAFLWKNLRGRRLGGKKFLRQHPIVYQVDTKAHYYIADFYCHEYKLVIEIDGGYHQKQEQKEYDIRRDEIINSLGITVIRFTNDEINDIEQVLIEISRYI